MTASRLGRRAGLVAAATAAMVALWAGPASADTSKASATAASLTLAGGGLASSGTVSATSDGQNPVSTGATQPALAVLGSQPLITSGVLVQKAVARNDGTSAACAGLVGSGGSISIGSDGTCTVNPGSGGVSIRLVGGLTPVDIVADAITSRCTATSAGVTTGGSTLTNARVSTLLGISLPTIPTNPGSGVSLSLTGVATILLNGQTQPDLPGSIRVSALYVSVLGSTARVEIGSSTCGTNTATLPVPAVPLSGWTVAAGAVVAGWAVLAVRFVRRRTGTVLVA